MKYLDTKTQQPTSNFANIGYYDPLYIGFDNIFSALQNKPVTKPMSYPPYNIEKLSEDDYLIEIACAGFSKEQLSVSIDNNKLKVLGEVVASENPQERNFIHKGLAERSFERLFTLAETIEVVEVKHELGLLKILLRNVIPENKKPRQIPIV